MTSSAVLPAGRPWSLDVAVPVGIAVAANAAVIALGARQLAIVALAVAVLVPVGIAVVRRPQRGVLALAALVPFDGLLLVVDHPGYVEGWKEAAVLVLLGATFLAPASSRGAPGRRLPGWVAAAAALLALVAASAVAVGGSQGLLGLKIASFYALAAVVVWRCPLDGRERDRLVSILVLTGVVTATVGVAQQVLGAERLNQLGYEYNSTIRFAGGYLRSFSTFVQPFPFGFFLMLVLLIGAAHALEDPARWRSRVFVLVSPLLVLGLLSSIVRAAWLGTAVGVLYLAMARHRRLLLVVPVLIVAVVLLPPGATEAATSSESSQERVMGWSANIERIVEHPLGEGIGTTGAVATRLAEEGDSGIEVYQPDNQYVKTGIELGPLGVWFLVLLLASSFATAHARSRRHGGGDGAFAAGVAAFVLGAAAASTMATFLEVFPLDLFFWLLVTAAAAVGAGAARSPAPVVAARGGWS